MSWSLVEADGKKFIEVYYIAHQKEATGPYHAESAQYYGFNDEGKWFFEGVGYTVSVRGDLSPCTHSISVGYRPNEEYTYWDCDLDEFTAVRAKYSEVKQFLYSLDAKEIIVVAP